MNVMLNKNNLDEIFNSFAKHLNKRGLVPNQIHIFNFL